LIGLGRVENYNIRITVYGLDPVITQSFEDRTELTRTEPNRTDLNSTQTELD